MKHDMLAGATDEQAQARFALRITAMLNESAQNLPNDVTERLRVARQNALQQAVAARKVALKPVVATSGLAWAWNRVLILAGGPSGSDSSTWWNKLATMLPLVVLVLGLLAIQDLHSSRLISTAADIDAALLADDLPPDAYQDAGFLEFLKRPAVLE
jgi:Protein of unknown function (DUF3619)